MTTGGCLVFDCPKSASLLTSAFSATSVPAEPNTAQSNMSQRPAAYGPMSIPLLDSSQQHTELQLELLSMRVKLRSWISLFQNLVLTSPKYKEKLEMLNIYLYLYLKYLYPFKLPRPHIVKLHLTVTYKRSRIGVTSSGVANAELTIWRDYIRAQHAASSQSLSIPSPKSASIVRALNKNTAEIAASFPDVAELGSADMTAREPNCKRH